MKKKSVFCWMILVFMLYVFAADAGNVEKISVNFEDADILIFIKFTSEITGKNFVIDESVKGRISIFCPEKIPVDELYNVMESVLFVKGFVAIPTGNIIKIVPLESAKQNEFMTISEQVKYDNLENRFFTHVISLEQANADNVLEIIKPLLTKGGYATVYEPANTLIITDIKDNIIRMLNIIEELDKSPMDKTSRVNVFKLEYADAQNLAEILNKMFEEQYKALVRIGKKSEDGRAYAIADKFTNTLIVNVPPQEILNIQKIIDKIDIKKSQILIEVLIIETNLDKASELGIEWAAIDGVMVGSPKGFGGDRVNRVEDIIPYVLTGGDASGYTAAFVSDVKNVGSFQIPEIGALITAFQNDRDVNILSTPQILTTDNEEAYILIGENRAFIKNAQVTAEGGTVRTFEFRDIGLSLRIMPHICEKNYVKMILDQKVEDVIGETFEGAVETAKREVKTQVTVKDGEMIVIGGLIKDSKKTEIEKVPVLGDIPLLGLLFRRTHKTSFKRNLMIFLSPHIIDSDEEIMQLTIQKKKTVAVEKEEKRRKRKRRKPRR